MNPDLSVVIPAHNEEECIESTLEDLCKTLEKESIDFEVIVSNDHSTDSGRILEWNLLRQIPASGILKIQNQTDLASQ